MKLKQIELQNYKLHKNYLAEFNGENKLVQGNKGSGKTSIMDAYLWLMTGTMVDDPMPVDETGEIINHLTVMVRAEFMDGTSLKIESAQRWSKDVLKANHSATYYVNDTPMILREYQKFLDEKFGTVEQRRIITSPAFFAVGDGLAVTSGVRKTAIQRRREIVLGAVGAVDLEEQILDNDSKGKQAKHAIGILKKEIKDAQAGMEELEKSKINTTDINEEDIKKGIAALNVEKSETERAKNDVSNSNNATNTLQQAINDVTIKLSNARSKYSTDYATRVANANQPYDEFLKTKNYLERELQDAKNQESAYQENLIFINDKIAKATLERTRLRDEYGVAAATQYVPDSVICPTCSQALPQDQLASAEARFNKHKADNLELILAEGKRVAQQITDLEAELEIPYRGKVSEAIQKELNALVKPIVGQIPAFEETTEYATLSKELADAQLALQSNFNDNALESYNRKLIEIDIQIDEYNEMLKPLSTNAYLDTRIEAKGIELQDLFSKLDIQEDILEKCNTFVRETIKSLESRIEETFGGIRFKMFTTTLEGEINDTCITYAKTENGYIRWENLSGGQKRSATIKLANAFAKAWDIYIPLWIDDTQIYVEDELEAQMQLIRITEVPNARLEIM